MTTAEFLTYTAITEQNLLCTVLQEQNFINCDYGSDTMAVEMSKLGISLFSYKVYIL